MKAKETLQSKGKNKKRPPRNADVKHGISAPKAGVGRPSKWGRLWEYCHNIGKKSLKTSSYGKNQDTL